MAILLNDILKLTDKELENTKIRFNIDNPKKNYFPKDLFLQKSDRLYEGQFWNTKADSFKENQIAISFLQLKKDTWLLFDICKVSKLLGKLDSIGYVYQTVEKYQIYFGRVILKFPINLETLNYSAATIVANCKVFKILDTIYQGEELINPKKLQTLPNTRNFAL